MIQNRIADIVREFKDSIKEQSKIIKQNKVEVDLENKLILKKNLVTAKLLLFILGILSLLIQPIRLLWVWFFIGVCVINYFINNMDYIEKKIFNSFN